MLILIRDHLFKAINRMYMDTKNKKDNASKKVTSANNANKKVTSTNNAYKKIAIANNASNNTYKIFDDILLDIENTIKSI